MALQKHQDSALNALARKLDKSPLPSSDRACLITLPDGSTRLGVTQVVNFVHHGGPYAGALFGRVSFRFAEDSSEFSNAFSPTHDVAWFIVDHKNGVVQFGPEEGLIVRHPGLGIGSYIVGQLLRILSGSTAHGAYKVVTSELPMSALDALPAALRAENERRIENVFGSAGFYLSSAAGVRVIGARKVAELKPHWNWEKVKFLNPGQLIDIAANSISTCRNAESAISALNVESEALRTDLASVNDDLQATRDKLEALAESLAAEQLHGSEREARLASELEEAKADLFRITGELNESKAAHLQQLPEPLRSPATPAVEPAADQTSPHLTFELGRQTLILAWAVVAGCFFLGTASMAMQAFR
ncbi:hypothetical protein QO021_29695 (plasmid) [Pseudomonas amygdali pv. lachrymans]|uniref:hypothetical protein n=1 Tax=Pseudomonas amygdali TaxID=47877 RepID=UPI0006B9E3B7|nr:hypothetical protein [Pseudomonas amygdali]KPC02122.1 putative transmembrane protein [Pseudomonas amygdali pv. lachrymans]RMM39562.1 hypothetical protein ALQ79_200720 [Pseudomonas amygdali pv. lachrymans]WIO61264.1 hypothetical protein QO021_29695 [Pseudomonas amygdali pv. lachrymans]